MPLSVLDYKLDYKVMRTVSMDLICHVGNVGKDTKENNVGTGMKNPAQYPKCQEKKNIGIK